MVVSTSTADDYAALLQRLRPPGPAWRAGDGLDLATADELSRVHNRATQLVDEADPRTADELFGDWERVAGLPDECVGADQSTGQRRNALIARLTSIGGQTANYYIQLAADLGYAVTVTLFDVHDVNSSVDDPINGPAWQFAWQVNAALASVVELTVADTVDDALAAWSNAALECVISRLKPAHTTVLFSYT